MKELIGHPPINISDFPMLFLLGLVDSVDPVKTFESINKKDDVLRNLKIGFTDNSVLFGTESIELSDFKKLKKKCDDLILWLDVSVESGRNLIKIIINDRKKKASA